jgi:LPXTG-site transpeptidase (sortase) family protein
MIRSDFKRNLFSYSALFLEAIALLLLAYLLLAPFYPLMRYQFQASDPAVVRNVSELASTSAVSVLQAQAKGFRASLPESEYSVSPNRLIIPKIGVNAPIIESSNEQYGLSLGSWHVPESSSPDRGGNTVLTGHRFKYLPPNNVTFYLFHKLKKGDIVTVLWREKDYVYEIEETKIVPASELSIMDQTKEATLTMFTCDPIYSTKNRLVVIAKLLHE